MMFKKSQAALEFLMTYGWAILVVLVAIGALAYFGVLSPDKFLPQKCTLPAGVACTDFTVDTNGVDVALRNGQGFDMNSVVVSIGGCGTATPDGDNILTNGEQDIFRATCTLTAGSKFSAEFGVLSTNADSGLQRSLNGSLTARVG
jgi:hypothetical protein